MLPNACVHYDVIIFKILVGDSCQGRDPQCVPPPPLYEPLSLLHYKHYPLVVCTFVLNSTYLYLCFLECWYVLACYDSVMYRLI